MAFGLTQSADFESGSSQYLTRADNALLEGGSAWSVECWVKLESDANMTFMSKGTSTSNLRCFVFRYNGAGSLVLQASSGGGSYDSETSVSWSPSTETWYHVSVTFSGSGASNEIKYYVDGTQQGATQTAGIASVHDNSGTFAIGCENTSPGTPGVFMDGEVSLARFWQEVRTQSEINDNKCEVLGSTTNLSGEWTLDNTLNDNSGNSLTLTDNGSVPFVVDVPSTCETTAVRRNVIFF